jgi:hypothetical protein
MSLRAFAIGLGLAASASVPPTIAGPIHVAQAAQSPAPAPVEANFGALPSGEIPILFNDRHVYSRPDRLKVSRVLAAIYRDGTILVPLRSMFEQMGATVTYNAATRQVVVAKPGSEVRVWVGRAEVVINGEGRPLDVAPEIYHGSIVVPLRVLSEGMGAFVQWIPQKRIVVVRYLAGEVPPPPTPVPAPPRPAPTAAPTAIPPTPAPPPPKSRYEHFILGDYIFDPRVYNEFSPGNTGNSSYRAAGAFEFPLLGLPWMLEGDFRSFQYSHDALGAGVCPSPNEPGCVSTIAVDPTTGNNLQAYVPAFIARDQDFEGRFALKVLDPRIYIGVGYLFRNSNYEGGAFPSQQHGIGFGLEKLPDLDQTFSVYGSAYYYPVISTNAAQFFSAGKFGSVQYSVLRYAVGGTFVFGQSPLFLDFGYGGDRGTNKQNAAAGFAHYGPYVGLGLRF